MRTDLSKATKKSYDFSLFFRRFLKREPQRQLTYVALALGASWLALPPACDLLARGWSDLAPRSGLGKAKRTPMRVCADHLSDAERDALRRDPNGVTAQQVTPRLALVGVGEGLVEVNGPSCKSAFEVGLLPEHAARLLNERTAVMLAVEAPSLTLLMEELVSSPRGIKLRDELMGAQGRLAERALALLPALTARLKEGLDPALAARLLKDPVVLAALQGAVTNELVTRVDWEGVAGGVLDSEELATLGALAVRHVRKQSVLYGATSEASQRVESGVDKVKEQVSLLSKEGLLTLDVSLCALKAASYGAIGASALSPALAPLSTLGVWLTKDADSQLCDEVSRAAKGVLTGALKGGARAFAQESFESLKREGPQSLSAAQSLAASAWAQADGAGRMRGLWLAIAGNEALHNHVVTTYGEPAWQALKGAALEVTKSEEVERLVADAATQLKELSQRALTALVLDREGEGPNPLLLAVAQEQLSGRARPVVRVTPAPPGAEGARVSDGYVFPSLSSPAPQEVPR